MPPQDVADDLSIDTLDVEPSMQNIELATPVDSVHDLKEKQMDSEPPIQSSRGPSISSGADAASVHSMPVVHVTEAPSPTLQPPRPPPPPPLSPASSSTQADDQQRRARRRSAIEPRNNRLSGFFTNLIHRRDNISSSTSREPIQEAPSSPNEDASRSSSPFQARPATPPPPPLPSPTLYELGLSLHPVTSQLSPSHFASPPHSGAFLLPHYLLLCHAQGLDVLPLVSPPAPQPYALVRRVHFKSVVVMEQRGVLVAIAGRRDGVRVYALEEVKKAIEWRMDLEIKRERDRQRRENVKKLALRSADDNRNSNDKNRKPSLSTPPPGDNDRTRTSLLRKSSHNPLPVPAPPPVPLIPRSATPRTPKKRPTNPVVQIPPMPSNIPGPSGHPPPYSGPSESSRPSLVSRSRSNSVTNVLTNPPSSPTDDSKADWQSSDDEAIDPVAAGTSGQYLDERTSATLASHSSSSGMQPIVTQSALRRNSDGPLRRNRPSNLDLSLARSSNIPPPEPSPAPTLLTLRQALSHPADVAELEEDEEEEGEVDGRISLAQALLESRIPDLPPIGTRQPQEPILITPTAAPQHHHQRSEPSSPQLTNSQPGSIGRNNDRRRRRRWSIMISSPSSETAPDEPSDTSPATAPANQSTTRFTRSQSFRSHHSQNLPYRSPTDPVQQHDMPAASVPDFNSIVTPAPSSSRSSRFIPRIISNAFGGRRSDERPLTPSLSLSENESSKWSNGIGQAPPPKLEYVKLPGTKGALLVKAVETAKKSFLAILCGDNGEKVELFAGTYRTALGLSRTFILPDSPRSLELQLQGDDLVEVFLVFAQNVFGLEPATVRVREVRIGRAERRAARRRARERAGELGGSADTDPPEEETNVNVSIGVSVPSSATTNRISEQGEDRSESPTLVASEHPSSQGGGGGISGLGGVERPSSPDASVTPATNGDDFVILGTAQMGAYTTFQQLGFAPSFPLASIADEYVIPPTYPSFVEYKAEHEPEPDSTSSSDVAAAAQFTPPGLPLPAPTAPSKWFYRDPKGVVHGPWKASLMQAWYKDGLLPPDLPVRREEDAEFMFLKDIRAQSVDPTQPFRPAVLSPAPSPSPSLLLPTQQQQQASLSPEVVLSPGKPLLSPISLLAQPRHFGPPALFFSSRGGHSTSIVDARGRSVLKGKFCWSDDESSGTNKTTKLGDIKRLEAFDIEGHSVLVAMRQGGLEVVDLSDALLNPADESRTVLPMYNPPVNNISRRAPFVWRMGTPITHSSNTNSNGTNATTITSTLPRSKTSSFPNKKSSLGSAKMSSGRADSIGGDFDFELQDEVLFLGRKEDEVYICEKNTASFRILRLSPMTTTTTTTTATMITDSPSQTI